MCALQARESWIDDWPVSFAISPQYVKVTIKGRSFGPKANLKLFSIIGISLVYIITERATRIKD